MDEPCNKGRSAVEASISDLVCKQEDGKAFEVRWKISKSHKGARILRKILSTFIKKIIEGMIGYVQLPKIMSKLLSDNGSQEFGDFKLTILGMLGTYDFEKKILVRLFHISNLLSVHVGMIFIVLFCVPISCFTEL